MGTAGLLQRGAGRRAGGARRAALSPAGNVTSAGGGRTRLAGCAALRTPRPGTTRSRAGVVAGMSAKERPKGKVIKDSVTLLPCFYFVEVSWLSALA